jgi:phage baseplate assembly protein W
MEGQEVIPISFGDVRLNMLFDNGFCRCHGALSPTRTANGDIARVTNPLECIYQRIGIWLGTKKGERPLHPLFGCCIRDYINERLTQSRLLDLKGQIEYELQELFPEYTVSNVRVLVPERNTIKVDAVVGNSPVEFLGNAATLNKLNSQLNAALKDLGMVSN